MNSILNYIPELFNINEYLNKLFGADTYELQQEWEKEYKESIYKQN